MPHGAIGEMRCSLSASAVVRPDRTAFHACTLVIMDWIMFGTREIMPANRMIEIPLPIPNSLTCSPSHITKLEPATNEMIMTVAGQKPDCSRMP